MVNWLKTLIGGAGSAAGVQSASLDQARQLQGLRLELAQREQEITRLQQEVVRLRDRAVELARADSQARLEQLLTDLSRPLGVLSALMTSSGGARDDAAQLEHIGNVLQQVRRALQDYGWQPVGQVGEVTGYDPDLHAPLRPDESPQVGEQVTVRWPGGACAGRVLLPAGVTLNRQAGR